METWNLTNSVNEANRMSYSAGKKKKKKEHLQRTRRDWVRERRNFDINICAIIISLSLNIRDRNLKSFNRSSLLNLFGEMLLTCISGGCWLEVISLLRPRIFLVLPSRDQARGWHHGEHAKGSRISDKI